MGDFEDRWEIPAKYRASLNMDDAATRDLLEKADKQQQEWAATANSPYATGAVQMRLRANALIMIDTLENARRYSQLTAEQMEQLAENYATIGRYDLAADASNENSDLYRKYWDAVWLEDDSWCEHPPNHKYLKEVIYSIKEGGIAPMLACNVCGVWNVSDEPTLMSREERQKELTKRAESITSIKAALSFHNGLRTPEQY